MKTAEQSAVVLLETLARTNDPQLAINDAFNQRMQRRSHILDAQRRGMEGRVSPSQQRRSTLSPVGPRPLPKRVSSRFDTDPRSLPQLRNPLRAPPMLPSGSTRHSSSRGTMFRAPAHRPASANQPRPLSRPGSASYLHRVPPPRGNGAVQQQRQPRMSMPERLRRSLSWDPQAPPTHATRRPPERPASATTPASDELGTAPPPLTTLRRGRQASNVHVLRQNRAREVKAHSRAVAGVFSR